MTVVKHWIPSPNFRDLDRLERVAMLYHFSGGNGNAVALGRFFQRSHNANGRRRGASHYGVGRDGVVAQYVSEADAAFHAGDGEFPGKLVHRGDLPLVPGLFSNKTSYSPNTWTIGVEVCNRGFAPSRKGRPRGVARHDNPRIFSRTWELYPEAQIDAVIELTREVMQRHPRMRYCLGHEDVTHQKADPGPVWPWRRITEATGLVRVRYNFAKQLWEVVE